MIMFIFPMLLHRSDVPKEDSKYINETKWDGHRLIFSRINGRTNLYTRHGNNVTYKYPELIELTDHEDIVLDGEVIYYDPLQNKEDFEILMKQRFLLSNPMKIKRALNDYPVTFIVFDILRFNGKNVCSLPLIERKRLLDEVISDSTYIQKNHYIEGRGSELFQAIKERGMEGIVQKKKYSLYQPATRSKTWEKVIAYNTAECFILGYKLKGFGWLVGMDTPTGIVPAGMVEFGPSKEERKVFYQVSKSLITKKTNEFNYIEPIIKCKVKFRNYTKNNKLRIPVFEEFVFNQC
jgi:DNA ligase 1